MVTIEVTHSFPEKVACYATQDHMRSIRISQEAEEGNKEHWQEPYCGFHGQDKAQHDKEV